VANKPVTSVGTIVLRSGLERQVGSSSARGYPATMLTHFKGDRAMRLLAFTLVTGLSASALAQFEHTTNNGTITITGYHGTGGTLVIPDRINDRQVTAIADAAFQNKTNLNYMVIPETVTRIGSRAFSGCSWLFGVEMPSGVQNIADYAFYRCFQLVDITIPEHATNIGDYAFADCPSLRDVSIPDRVKSIGASAFQSCWRLTSLTIGDGVTSIAPEAFVGCRALESVNIGDGVTTIWPWAFANCTNLTNVVIGAGVTNIATGYDRAFEDCSSLSAITVQPDNPTYSSVAGVLFDKTRRTLVLYPAARIGDYAVPEGVMKIGDYAFESCTALTNVTLPNSVTNIAGWAFRLCVKLSSILLGENVISIGEGAFANCDRLKSIVFPDSVRDIGPSAFHGCMRLERVIMGRNVAHIGQGAFQICSSLREIFFMGNSPSLGSYPFFNSFQATVYYLPGTTGWHPTLEGRPTILWDPRMQTPRAGTNGFGLDITGNTNIVVVVEACSNLADPVWTPLATNSLSGGASQFNDPDLRNFPSRFYRLRPSWAAN